MPGQVIEGLGTTLTIGSASLCYVTLSAPGLEGGVLDATCLDNSAYMTSLPAKLKKITEASFTARFEPAAWTLIAAEVNVNRLLTFSFNYQGTAIGTLAIWGFLKTWTPEAGAIGTTWNGGGTLEFTCMNGSYAETAPVWTAAP